MNATPKDIAQAWYDSARTYAGLSKITVLEATPWEHDPTQIKILADVEGAGQVLDSRSIESMERSTKRYLKKIASK